MEVEMEGKEGRWCLDEELVGGFQWGLVFNTVRFDLVRRGVWYFVSTGDLARLSAVLRLSAEGMGTRVGVKEMGLEDCRVRCKFGYIV